MFVWVVTSGRPNSPGVAPASLCVGGVDTIPGLAPAETAWIAVSAFMIMCCVACHRSPRGSYAATRGFSPEKSPARIGLRRLDGLAGRIDATLVRLVRHPPTVLRFPVLHKTGNDARTPNRAREKGDTADATDCMPICCVD